MEFNLHSLLLVFLASVLGSMGLGGGSLLLLYLMLFTDLPQAEAQAINLFLFLPTAAVAILLHKKNGLL
ncbi:MAG: sulfite exporter TauE/SafE family protein, partial [Oscillospiraceae bacterium]|nr:sulfite exporter TauE/SafE family protein [Oscillospiraceae bacterium]